MRCDILGPGYENLNGGLTWGDSGDPREDTSISILPSTDVLMDATPIRLGHVDEVPCPQPYGSDKNEADIAVGGLVVSGGQSAAVLEL